MDSTQIFSRSIAGAPVAADDETLLARVATGDRDALGLLYAEFQRPIFRYLFQLTSDAGLAEEILQDTFVAVWRSAGTFQSRSMLRTWLFGIARRQAHNVMRRPGVKLQDVDDASEVADPGPEPEDRVLAQADVAMVRLGIARLSVAHREVLALKFVSGLGYQEMALITGVPEGTVKSRLNAARRALRQILSEDGPG
ncbi:MAG: sigma-70 family RNA polymerase sigma factor [Chloroflexi bacterium]|nr:sigma-70 family RNA polymerase sigma factor [Chloroflexota bacterium]